MVSVYDIKPAFQNLLRPVVKQFAKMGITANQTTLLAAVLSIIVGGVFYFNSTSPEAWVSWNSIDSQFSGTFCHRGLK